MQVGTTASITITAAAATTITSAVLAATVSSTALIVAAVATAIISAIFTGAAITAFLKKANSNTPLSEQSNTEYFSTVKNHLLVHFPAVTSAVAILGCKVLVNAVLEGLATLIRRRIAGPDFTAKVEKP